MTDRELSIAIKEIGLAHGMCGEYSGKWREDYTQDELMDLFISGQDFCIEHDFPPVHFIKKYFDVEKMHEHNIFCGDKVTKTIDASGILVLLSDTQADFEIGGFAVVEIYVRHRSSLHLKVRDNAIVKVSVYDEGFADIEQLGIHSVKLYDRRKKKEG